MSNRRVAYYYDPDIGSFSYGWAHPMKPFRMRLTHSLVSAYGMLPKLDVIRPTRATPFSMTRFHTDEYIDFLHRVTPETVMDMTGGGARFLSGDDNPAFEGVFEFSSISAGGSIAAAERINSGMADIAVNWAGGLHHAKKGEGSGFCYINDIVLAILELLRFHTRVLYIDIDFHHGDGVEEAFYSTDRVLTCSFHKQKDCFPGTGKVEDRGIGKGKGYSVNIPLLQGITDEGYKSIFEPVIQHILDWFRPDAVVLQCGADSLSEDKLGCFNLSMQGHADCVRFLRKSGIPLILLGGGGYTVRNVASAWTYETAIALGIDKDLDLDVPYSEYLEWYGPRYKLEIKPSNITDDNNTRNYLENTKQQVLEQLRDLPFAPSAQGPVPRRSVAEELGLNSADDEGEDYDLDVDAAIRERVKESMRRHTHSYDDEENEDDHDRDDATSDTDGDGHLSSPISFSRNARNFYFEAPLPKARFQGHHEDSDEEVRISDDEDIDGDGNLNGEDMDVDEDRSIRNHDGRGAQHRSWAQGNGSKKGARLGGNQNIITTKPSSHGHGTRAAMAQYQQNIIGADSHTYAHLVPPVKRSFFTSSITQLPIPSTKNGLPSFGFGVGLSSRPNPPKLKLWDGTQYPDNEW